MYNLNNELKTKIEDINNILLEKYEEILSLDRNLLRKYIKDGIGDMKKLKKMTTEELKKYAELGGIMGVDGSKNRLGGAYPHYIEIYQGLAKSTLHIDKPIYKANIYTPLYSEENTNILEDSEEEKKKSDRLLAEIELDAALEGIKEFNPYVLIMDGSMIRYYIDCVEKWLELKEECQNRGIIIIGVTKDIKTFMIGDKLRKEREIPITRRFPDKEILHGTLDYGEVVLIDKIETKKEKVGFRPSFLRSSNSPDVIGVDILIEQAEHLEEMARLVFTLTPKDGRGVPLWLDIVDSEVKIPDVMIRSLLESYLDRRLLEMLFISERDKRTL